MKLLALKHKHIHVRTHTYPHTLTIAVLLGIRAQAQFLLYPILSSSDLLAIIASNTLYALAFGYYHYLTFLGYNGSYPRRWPPT
jgi:hypothetical protein